MLNHRFKHTCYDPDKLLKGCNKLSTFMSRLVAQSESDPDTWDPLTYRGDGFEAFVECLIKGSPLDNRINIVDYKPWDSKINGSDMGIDGVGRSGNTNRPHAVQVKFRSNTQSFLTANQDHISNFVAKSESEFGPDRDMTIFTTADDLLKTVNEGMYGKRVNTFGYTKLRKLVDNNKPFWDYFHRELTS
jgi:hypothetical protein